MASLIHDRRVFALLAAAYKAQSMQWAMAIADQAVVSGTRFMVAMILARFAGPQELGRYTLAFTALLLAGCLQEALLTTPYAVFGSRLGRRARASYGGGMVLLHGILAGAGTLAFLIIAALFSSGLTNGFWVMVTLAVAISFPCSLLWEFARRSTLAHLDVATALLIDMTVAILQLAGLATLAMTGLLTAPGALAVVAVSCVAVGGVWLVSTNSRRKLRWRLTHLYWKRNWKFGRWIFADQVVAAMHRLAPAWILAAVVGTYVTGAFVACFNLALLANPLIFAIGNLLTPRAARVYATAGRAGLDRVLWKTEALLAGSLLVFAVALTWCGEGLVSLVYGTSYQGLGIMPTCFGLCAVAWATSAVFASGLAAIKRPALSFMATLIGAAVSALVIALAARQWHALGATAGLLVGSWVAAVIQVAAFTTSSCTTCQPT